MGGSGTPNDLDMEPRKLIFIYQKFGVTATHTANLISNLPATITDNLTGALTVTRTVTHIPIH